MAEARYVKKALYEIFDFSISTNNANLTKTFVNNNKGDVPVYGASQYANIPSYGYIQDGLENIKYFNDCLTYNRDGASGKVFFRKGHFTLSEKVLPLIVKEEYIANLDNNYLQYAIENESRKQMYTFANKATKFTFKNIEISIPIMKNGSFDLDKQIILAKEYEDIEKKRQILIDKSKELMGISVLLFKNNNNLFSEVKLLDVFSKIDRGNSRYTRTYCKEHLGDYPVYSADNQKPLGYMDSYDYKGEYLTISINGIAGKITILNECFSTNADRVVCIPKDNIDISYIKFVAEPLLRNRSKGRKGDLGKNEFSKLTPKMVEETFIPIPIKADGSFDFEKQKELSSKYEQIENIKTELKNKIDELTNIVVS